MAQDYLEGFDRTYQIAEIRAAWSIGWRLDHLSASFPSRDLFAPVASGLVEGVRVPGSPIALEQDQIHCGSLLG